MAAIRLIGHISHLAVVGVIGLNIKFLGVWVSYNINDVDLNNIVRSGAYTIYSSSVVQNGPFNTGTSYILIVFCGGGYFAQMAISINSGPQLYIRTAFGATKWCNWYKADI